MHASLGPMRRDEPRTARVIESIVSELGASDVRVSALTGCSDDTGVVRLVCELLNDRTTSLPTLRKVLWLVPLFFDDEILESVIRFMRTRPEYAQSAARQLASIGGTRVVAEMVKVVSDAGAPAIVRGEAATVLADVDDPSARAVLLNVLRSGVADPSMIVPVIKSLGYLDLVAGEANSARDIERMLTAGSVEIRVAAIEALRNMDSRNSVPAIAVLIGSDEKAGDGRTVGQIARQAIAMLDEN